MKISLLLPFLALSLLAVGCTEEPTTPISGPHVQSIMPMAEGNMWVGSETTYDALGAPVAVHQDTLQILTFLTEKDGGWFADDNRNRYRNSASGLFFKNALAMHQLAKYPAQPGDTFTTGQRVITPTDTAYRSGIRGDVVSTDTTVTTPAGTFHCYHYRSEGWLDVDSTRIYQVESAFYAPGVGLVMRQVNDTTGVLKLRWELQSYVVNE